MVDIIALGLAIQVRIPFDRLLPDTKCNNPSISAVYVYWATNGQQIMWPYR